MNKWKYFLIFFILEIVQASVMPHIIIFGATPNITLAAIVTVSIVYGPGTGGYTGLVIGLLEDLLFAQVIGVRALIYYTVAYVIGRVAQNTSKYLPTGMAMTAIATTVTVLGNMLIYKLLGHTVYISKYLEGPIFVEAVINMLLYLLVIFIIIKVLKPKSLSIYKQRNI